MFGATPGTADSTLGLSVRCSRYGNGPCFLDWVHALITGRTNTLLFEIGILGLTRRSIKTEFPGSVSCVHRASIDRLPGRTAYMCVHVVDRFSGHRP
jgi:hypothetical protein